MEFLLIMLFLSTPFLVSRTKDPAPGFWQSKEEARNLECVRRSQAEAHELDPSAVPAPPVRSTMVTVDALVCTPRIRRHGERGPQDEAILAGLRGSVQGIIEAAAASVKGDVTWHVDAFYPEPRVASKISVAARTELAESGRRVSDRVPLLAAGDLSVLRGLPPQEKYRLACARYFAEGSLTSGQAFLGLMVVDPRETQLHAGLCLEGEWRWLQ